jgi:hypothetical protein
MKSSDFLHLTYGNTEEHTEVDSHKPFPQTWRLKPTNTPVSPPGTTRTRQYPRRGPATHAGDHSPLTPPLDRSGEGSTPTTIYPRHGTRAQPFSCPWRCAAFQLPVELRACAPTVPRPLPTKRIAAMALMPMGHDILYLPPRATPWDDNQGIGLVTFFR